MADDSRSLAALSKRHKSIVTTGRRLFPRGVDGRTAAGRRWRDLYLGYLDRLGGEDRASEYQRGQFRALAALRLGQEQAEARLVTGERLDLEAYSTATNTWRRLARDLGLHKAPEPEPAWPADGAQP